jgi:hypothetical protein
MKEHLINDIFSRLNVPKVTARKRLFSILKEHRRARLENMRDVKVVSPEVAMGVDLALPITDTSERVWEPPTDVEISSTFEPIVGMFPDIEEVTSKPEPMGWIARMKVWFTSAVKRLKKLWRDLFVGK